jgi:hypothetical protein
VPRRVPRRVARGSFSVAKRGGGLARGRCHTVLAFHRVHVPRSRRALSAKHRLSRGLPRCAAAHAASDATGTPVPRDKGAAWRCEFVWLCPIGSSPRARYASMTWGQWSKSDALIGAPAGGSCPVAARRRTSIVQVSLLNLRHSSFISCSVLSMLSLISFWRVKKRIQVATHDLPRLFIDLPDGSI